MKTISLILALCLSTSALAQEPEVINVESGTVVSGGLKLDIGPGVYMNEPAALITAKSLEQYKAENATLKTEAQKAPTGTSTFKTVALVAVGVLVGAGAAFVYTGASK